MELSHVRPDVLGKDTTAMNLAAVTQQVVHACLTREMIDIAAELEVAEMTDDLSIFMLSLDGTVLQCKPTMFSSEQDVVS